MSSIKNVTVVGAGTMGNGIAQVFATHAFHVTLLDTNSAQLEKALATIQKNLDRLVTKETITAAQKEIALAHLTTSTILATAVSNADLVVEAATENKAIKLSIFEALDAAAPPHAILASNTSSISISEIASVTKRPAQVIGMHFMNPVPIMKLVEIINGKETSAVTSDTIVELSKVLLKIPCVVNDFPGFIANRILMPMINEAIYALYQGVATKESIDTIMKLGMAHPMGPLQLADFIGLDVCLSILDVLYEGFKEEKYAPCPLLVRMVADKKLGVKSGAGFYTYGV
jgi:3-hydroxybutyryl-CoA dehydrogenase